MYSILANVLLFLFILKIFITLLFLSFSLVESCPELSVVSSPLTGGNFP